MSARAQETWTETAQPSGAVPARATPADGWTDTEDGLQAFGEEQLRGLIWRVFLGPAKYASRHILIGAVDRPTDSGDLCARRGRALVRESLGATLLVSADAAAISGVRTLSSLRGHSARLTPNLWTMESCVGAERILACESADRMEAFLQQIRREFDYSILQVGWSRLLNDVIQMGQATDGVILVLGAHNTRKAAAQQAVRTLTNAGVRLIGTVLTGREFPVPEILYHRL